MSNEPNRSEILEALNAFSTHMDDRFDRLEADVSGLKKDVSVLKTDVSVLKSDVSVLKKDVSVLKADVSVLKSDMRLVKATMVTKNDLGNLVTREYLEGRLAHIC